MKLISCHINNFGTFKDKDFTFHDGINSFMEDNGSGKSTLASFILSMLYGMESYKSNTSFRDRIHYAPFNKEIYGGTLILKHQNHTYRIERNFDKKSQSKDETIFYKDNEKWVCEKEIGEELLGLNKESFQRLLFLTSKEIIMESNGDIKKQLNTIIDDTVEGLDYEKIDQDLDAEIKEYNKRGNNIIKEKQSQKKDLDNQIIEQKNMKNILGNKYENRKILSEELDKLQQQQKLYLEQKSINECWENYDAKQKEIRDLQDKLQKYDTIYFKGYPSMEEIKQLENWWENKKRLEESLKELKFKADKQEKLERYRMEYKNGYPDETQIKEIEEGMKEKEENERRVHNFTLTLEEKNKLEEYQNRYKTDVLDSEDSKTLQKDLQEFKKEFKSEEFNKDEERIYQAYSFVKEEQIENVKNWKKEYDTLKKENRFISSSQSKRNMGVYILGGLSIIALGVGIGLCFVVFLVGIILIVLGFILALGSGFFYLKKRIDRSVATPKEEETETLKRKIYGILTPLGIGSDSLDSDCTKFDMEMENYQRIKRRREKQAEEKLEFDNTHKELKEEIEMIFSKYFKNPIKEELYDDAVLKLMREIPEYAGLIEKDRNYSESENQQSIWIEKINKMGNPYGIDFKEKKFSDWKNELIEYKALEREYKEYIEEKNKKESEHSKIKNQLDSFSERYAIPITDQIHKVNQDVSEVNRLQQDIKQKKAEAENYKKEKNLTERLNFTGQENFQQQIKDKTAELNSINNEIRDIENNIESLEDNQERVEELEISIEKDNRWLEILQTVKSMLKQAQKNLDERYVSPVMTSFRNYSEMMNNAFGYEIEMGRNFNIQLVVNGRLEQVEHFSAGQRCVCELCFRMALLDNIFKTEMPFILMDDPFVALDEKNLKLMKRVMVEKIGKDKQILYFSCHKSREME